MRNAFRITVVLLAFSLSDVAVSLSFAGQKTESLEEIVVTATKIEEPKKDVSVTVQIITQEDIKNSIAKNAGDLIVEAAIGHVHKYPGVLTARVGVRGLFTDLFNPMKDRVLILINGHPAGTNNLAKIHSRIGELIGKAVYEAVIEALEKQNGFKKQNDIFHMGSFKCN